MTDPAAVDLSVPLAVRAAPPDTLPSLPGDAGLIWVPSRLDLAAALAALARRVQEADDERVRVTEDEVTEDLARPWGDRSTDSRVGLDDQGVPRAWIDVEQPGGDERVIRAFLSGRVDPAWRGRGLGAALIAWGTARARQMLAESGKDGPGRIGMFLDDPNTAAADLAARSGFTPVRYYTDMVRSLVEPLDVPLPAVREVPGVQVVPWSDDLDEPVRVAHNEAFRDHWGSEPRTVESWQAGRSFFAPQWSHVALDEGTGEVAGYVISARYPDDGAVSGRTSGSVELLGVRRAWRGRGLGVALLATVLRTYQAAGVQAATLHVDNANPSGALGLYTSVGFVPEMRVTQHSIEM